MVSFVRVGHRAAWTFIGWLGLTGAAGAQAPAALPAPAAGQPPAVYRCPGPPVLYTDSLSPSEARSRNCKPLTDLPVAVAPPTAPVAQPRPPLAAPPSAAAAPSGGSPEAPAATPTSAAVLTVPAAPPPVATVNALPAGSQPVPRGGTRVPIPPAGPSPAPVASAAGTGAAAPTPPATAVATVPLAPPADSRVRPDDQRSRDAEARRILEAELRREEARLSEALRTSNSGLRPGERLGADAAQIRRAESDIEAIRRELGRLR